MDQSKLFIFSIGYVAENKELGTNKIQVFPAEHLNLIDGEIKSNPLSVETQGTDVNGQAYSTKVTADNSIEATWLKLNSNRKTSPDVRRGESVIIWKYADVDEYFWTPTGFNEHLRKGETVVYTFSATSNESEDGTEKGNCYYVEVSTHLGQITLETTNKMGELTTYGIQLNTKEGYLLIQDGLNNAIELDSKNTKITLQNSNQTTIVLDQENIACQAKDSINLSASKNINLTCQNLTINASSNVTANTATFNVSADNSYSVSTLSYEVTSPNMHMNVQNSTFDGSCSFTGTTTMSNTAINGSLAVLGAMNALGTMNVSGLITCNGIVSTGTINGPHGSI